MTIRAYYLVKSLSLAALLVLGCSESSGPNVADAGSDGAHDQGAVGDGASADQQAQADADTPTGLRVAAVQYSEGDFSAAPGCGDDICGVSHFIKEGANIGAKIIVVPEGVFDQKKAELAPSIGDAPATDDRWPDGTISRSFAKLASELQVTVIINLVTQQDSKLYNTSLALGSDGKVVARHFKFQLFGNEPDYYTPGPSVETSFFDTPAGRAGLMICADAQCIVTGLNVTPDCTQHAVDLLKDYFNTRKPKIVFFSAFWSVGGDGIWAALNVQQKVATDGNVWLVAANNTQGQGQGGGIFKPGGELVTKSATGKPAVIHADIPF